MLGPQVQLVSSDVETAKDVYRTLLEHQLLNDTSTVPKYNYRATGANTAAFRTLANRFLGASVEHVGLLRTGAITLPQRDEKALSSAAAVTETDGEETSE